MSQPPTLTDHAALMRQRRRITPDRGLFLHDLAIDEIKDRIALVNRSFRAIAIVTGAPDHWRAHFPDATIVPDTEVLSLTQNAHDLVLHTMALHWANDPVGQLIQCHRALRPDGHFIAATFGGQTLQELRATLAQAESDLSGGLSPRVLPMADLRDLGALLQRARFALPVSDTLPLKVTYETSFHLMQDLRHMGETNAMQARGRTFTSRKLFERTAELYAKHHSADGRITATFELIFLAGWAPSANQPQPLRPGSASQRLADALKTDEHRLKP